MLGSDFSAVEDLDFGLTFLEGEAAEQVAYAQAIARRYLTPRGGHPRHPEYGLDLRVFLVDSISPTVAEGVIGAEAMKDPRTESARCTVGVNEDGEWAVDVTAQPYGEGPFHLTFVVTPEEVSRVA
jgi:phage baseplate assembly protein W